MHEGHRQRLRNKVKKANGDVLEKHELLELILFHVIPVRDTNKLSHRLLKRFGSFESIFNATVKDLCSVDGIGEKTALFLKAQGSMYNELKGESFKSDLECIDYIGNSEITDKIISEKFSKANHEFVLFILADRKKHIISYDITLDGDIENFKIEIKKILKQVAKLQVRYVIIAHNHLTGFSLPTKDDHEITKIINANLSLIGVKLLDHCIFSNDKIFSLAKSGLMPR